MEELGKIFRETAVPGVANLSFGRVCNDGKGRVLAKAVIDLVDIEADRFSDAPRIIVAETLDARTEIVPEVRVLRHMPFPHFPEAWDGAGYAVCQRFRKVDVQGIERMVHPQAGAMGKQFAAILRLDESGKACVVGMSMAHEDIRHQMVFDAERLQGKAGALAAVKQEQASRVLDEKGRRTSIGRACMDAATGSGTDGDHFELSWKVRLQERSPGRRAALCSRRGVSIFGVFVNA